MRATAVALVATVAVLAAHLAPVASQSQQQFLACQRIRFDEEEFANGFTEDALLERFGVRILVRRQEDDQETGTGQNPPDYSTHRLKLGAIFNAQQVSGSDYDLGRPNYRCREPCPPQFASCPLCQQLALADQAGIVLPFEQGIGLPAGVSCTNPDGSYNHDVCPGIGCGGGRFRMSPNFSLPEENILDYPEIDRNGNLVRSNFETDACTYDLVDGCPVLNPGMNCKAGSNRLLIIREGATRPPDDEGDGGSIQFIFDEQVSMLSMSVLDMDEAAGGIAPGFIYGEASPDPAVNTFDRSTELVGLGDNSLNNIDFLDANIPGGNPDFAEIRRLIVWFRGSGSINDLEFCTGIPPNVTLETMSECKATWEITKEVNQEVFELFAGEEATEVYTTRVTKTDCGEQTLRASGTIETGSPNSRRHQVIGVFGGFDPNTGTDADSVKQPVEFTCLPYTPTPLNPFVLDPADPENTLVCSFDSAVLPDALDGMGRSNLKVEFETRIDAANTGNNIVGAGIVQFDTDTVFVDASATVVDPDASPSERVFTESGEYASGRDVRCGLDQPGPFTFSCTATLTTADTGTVLEATAGTTRTCYQLDVEKSAAFTFRRYYDWSLDKTASPATDTDTSVVSVNEMDDPTDVQYSFKITATPSEDMFQLNGSVTVSNNHPSRDAVADVFDVTYPSAVFTDDCLDGQVTVPAGGSVSCDFSVLDLDGVPKDLQNTFLASMFGIQYTATADFDATPTIVNDTVSVYDVFEDTGDEWEFGPFTATGMQTMTTFFGSRQFSPEVCDVQDTIERSYPNTARVQNTETGFVYATDNWTVTIITVCPSCPDCVNAPMYPMALGDDGRYKATSEEGDKFVTLCWD